MNQHEGIRQRFSTVMWVPQDSVEVPSMSAVSVRIHLAGYGKVQKWQKVIHKWWYPPPSPNGHFNKETNQIWGHSIFGQTHKNAVNHQSHSLSYTMIDSVLHNHYGLDPNSLQNIFVVCCVFWFSRGVCLSRLIQINPNPKANKNMFSRLVTSLNMALIQVWAWALQYYTMDRNLVMNWWCNIWNIGIMWLPIIEWFLAMAMAHINLLGVPLTITIIMIDLLIASASSR